MKNKFKSNITILLITFIISSIIAFISALVIFIYVLVTNEFSEELPFLVIMPLAIIIIPFDTYEIIREIIDIKRR